MRRFWWIALVVACSGKGDPVPVNPVRSITVTLSASQVVVGATARATAVLRDAAGVEVTDQIPTWTSISPTVASVDANGVVTGLAAGTAVIRASSGGVSSDGSIVVVNPKAASIAFARDTATVFLPGGSVQLFATVRDSAGNVIANPTIFWQSTAPLIASVNALGLVTPLAVGSATIRASLDGQLATAVVTVRATPNANAPTVTAIAPSSPLRPGASYVLTGTNFATTIAGNVVVVDGVSTTVTAASATSLSVTLPTTGFPCEPTHGVYLQVTANGLVGASAATLQAATQRALQPGQSVIVTNAAEVRCNELVAPAGRYVVSVYNAGRQSVTPSTAAPAQFQVRGAVSATAASSSVVAAMPVRVGAAARSPVGRALAVPRIGGRAFDDAALLRRLRLHDMAHADIQRRNLENLRANAAAIRAAAAARSRLSLARTASSMGTLGAITPLKVPNLDAGNFCQSSVPVGARTVYVGQHALILEDTASTYNGAPTLAGQMDSWYAGIGQEFDTVMWPILTADFGNPLAMDAQLSGTGKIVMLFSPKVNAMQSGTVLGFVVSCDFSPVSQQPSSNVGEYFYAVVPTSAALGYTSVNGRDSWLRLMRGTVIHEVKHITAYGERLSRGLPLEEYAWEEGMARNVEELYARAAFYKTTQKSDATYTATLACDLHYTTPGPCLDRPLLMLRHFDALYTFAGQTEFVSPLGRTFAGDQTFYATSWALERWAADQFGAPESEFFKAWTTSASTGVANLERSTGRPWEESLGEWSLAMYLDDLSGFAPADGRLAFPGYNLRDMWLGMCSDLGPCVNPNTGTQLYPSSDPWTVHAAPFGNFLTSLNLSSGSFALFDLSGPSAPSQLIELRTLLGGDPPPTVRLAFVRVQ